MREAIRNGFIDAIKYLFAGTLVSLKAWLISASFNLALIGGTICVLLYVAGWAKGMRMTGILFVAHVIIRTILG